MANDTQKKSPRDADSEFVELFWKARFEHGLHKENFQAAAPSYEAVLEFAKKKKWKWAEQLVKASRDERCCRYDQAMAALDECEASVPDRHKGTVQFIRGAAHSGKAEVKEAIREYRMVVSDPRFGRPGIAWSNLGNALRKEGNLDEAISAYHKALETLKGSPTGSTWNNLGVALQAKGDVDGSIRAFREAIKDETYGVRSYALTNLGLSLAAKGRLDGAIEVYRKALKDPEFPAKGMTWNSLGVALQRKGKLKGAIKAFQTATEDKGYATPAKAWANLGQAYQASKKPKLAKAAFEKALAGGDPSDADHARARRALQLLESKLAPSSMSPDDRSRMVNPVAPAQTDQVEAFLQGAIDAAGQTQYEKYVSKPDSRRDNTLSVLRGWSSAVTLLEGSERRWRGGGYFLKWQGHGLVLDPGFDFLRNFHDAGYHGREISVVVVSHNHPDHNTDLKAIDDLLYELWTRRTDTREPYALLWDEDSSKATTFAVAKPEHRRAPIIFSLGLQDPIDLGRHAPKLPFRVTPFEARHGKEVPNAVGMVIELLNKNGATALRIGYTADTGYYDELPKHLGKCDLLIAHISQPSIDELKDASKLKEVHLGYRGTIRLIAKCKPKLTLIGEFWAGFADLRIALVKGVRLRSGVEPVLPAGLSMHVMLPSLEVECTRCGKASPFQAIKVAPCTDSFGSLGYVCPECMLS